MFLPGSEELRLTSVVPWKQTEAGEGQSRLWQPVAIGQGRVYNEDIFAVGFVEP